mgnify:CR=1 FL=1
MSILKVENITKVFPGTVALSNVNIEFESGKVNALLGKNGSGKSTLVKIINGVHEATSGRILLDGKEIKFSDPKEAMNNGVATVFQELSLVPGMSVAENIWMGRLPMKGKFVDWKKTYQSAQELLDSIGIDINPKEMVYNLSMWQMQMIEIAKAMSFEPKVLLLDEPTSALAHNEVEMLFKLIRELKKKDVIIIYISHKLQELWEIADNCTVLRDGILAGRLDMKECQHKDVIRLMFGDVEVKCRPADLKPQDEVVLKVENLCRDQKFKNISFELRKGEILGIAGMLGSGRTELLRSIFGVDRFDSGKIYFEGKEVKNPTPKKMKELGLALTPEDRKLEGLVQHMTVKQNLTNASLKLISKGVFIDRHRETEFANRQIENLEIKTPSVDAPVSSLSGGNQQKVVVGNWLNTSPKVIFLDEPSRGIDVGAKQQIFEIIWNLSRQGIASIVVSSELEELLEVCNRIIVLRLGVITGEIEPENCKLEDLYAVCMGGK